MTLRQMTDIYDLQVKWCDLYVESALFDLNRIYDENAYMENAHDLDIFTEAAEKAGNKVFTAIKTLFSKLGDYIGGVINKIKTAGIKNKMEKMKMCNNNETIEVEDPGETKKNLSEYRDATKKCREKAMRGEKLTDADKERVESAKKKCKSPVKKIIKIAAVVIGLQIGVSLTHDLVNLHSDMKDTIKKYDDKIAAVDRAKKDAEKNAIFDDTNSNLKERHNDFYYAAKAESEYLKEEAIQKVKNANLFNKIFGFLFSPKGVNDKSIEDARNKRDNLINNYNTKHAKSKHEIYDAEDLDWMINTWDDKSQD